MVLALLAARGIAFTEPDPGGDFDPPDLAWTDDLVGLLLAQNADPKDPTAAIAALLADA